MASCDEALVLTVVPLLRVQSEIYKLPRGRDRFRAYLESLTGGTDDMVRPLAVMNPMGRAEVEACVDALIALDAEGVARDAAADAQRRLRSVEATLKTALVVADDARGGWTNRHFTDAAHRFENKYTIGDGWALVLLWTSEEPSPKTVRREALAAIYRALYVKTFGPATTLKAMMAQEGLASVFAGDRPSLADDELEAAGAIVTLHEDSTSFQVIFACLYGDEAAEAVGYSPLGLPPNAGYELATADALKAPLSAEDVLCSKRRR